MNAEAYVSSVRDPTTRSPAGESTGSTITVITTSGPRAAPCRRRRSSRMISRSLLMILCYSMFSGYGAFHSVCERKYSLIRFDHFNTLFQRSDLVRSQIR
jgi:hypothetical protein